MLIVFTDILKYILSVLLHTFYLFCFSLIFLVFDSLRFLLYFFILFFLFGKYTLCLSFDNYVSKITV